MVSAFALISTIGAATGAIIGLFLSPIPTNAGFYTYLASIFPELIGFSPAFNHGIEWQYTFEELYETCPNLISGQRALVTGANSGVGYETAKALAKCGVHVTMACRTPKKCTAAAEKIRAESKDNGFDNQVDTMTVDTSSLKSVQTFSNEYLAKYDTGDGAALDILYLNAGIGSTNSPKKLALSEDGIELMFATNYVGHHLMYRLLEPFVLKSKMARIVQTSSSASFNTFNHKVATSLDVLNSSPPGKDMTNYGQSKLAQILWVKYLTKRNKSNNVNNVYANVCHPGAVDTGIWDKNGHIPELLKRYINYLRRNVMWTTEEGALTQLYLGVATDKLAADDIRGMYYHPQAQEVVNPLSLDEKLQSDLWKFSDELVSKFL